MGTHDIAYVGTLISSENIITTLTETSSSTTTGALRIAGGAGLGSLYVEGLSTLNGASVLNGSLTMGTNNIVSVGSITSSSNLITTLTETSSSTTTGALRIAGGAGIGSLYVAGLSTLVGNATLSGTLYVNSTSTLNAATVLNGSLTMGTNDIVSVGTITSSENIITTLTETSTSTSTGALRVSGGAGLGSLYVDNNAVISGTLYTDFIAKESIASSGVTFNPGSVVYINDTTNAAALNSGSLQVSGGGSIAKTLYVQTVIPTNLTMTNNVTLISTDGTLVNNSNTTLPTEQAVKTYVDNHNHVWIIRDVKASGTAGGDFTSGVWQTRVLNTITGDTTDTSVTLGTNQIVLTRGKYKICAYAMAQRVNANMARIENITAATTIEYGQTSASITGANIPAIVNCLITTTTTITIELQHRCTTTRAGDGYGLATTFGNNNIYAEVVITKVGTA
jgi:hypothetical protein